MTNTRPIACPVRRRHWRFGSNRYTARAAPAALPATQLSRRTRLGGVGVPARRTQRRGWWRSEDVYGHDLCEPPIPVTTSPSDQGLFAQRQLAPESPSPAPCPAGPRSSPGRVAALAWRLTVGVVSA